MVDERAFRQAFFRALEDRPLTPTDPHYLPLYEPESDVILFLKETISFSPADSAQLLSGYRGSGKSTELRRLKQMLEAEGYAVLLIDLEDHLDLHTPIDVTDFLLALCGAVGEALRASALLSGDPLHDRLDARLWNFLNSQIAFKGADPKLDSKAGDAKQGVQFGLGSAIRLELRTNPLFRQQVQQALAQSLGRFNNEVRGFFAACGERVAAHHGGAGLVVLVDSIEHARGTNDTEAQVHAALERLFSSHAEKLKLPGAHMVYTVPPWLRIRRPNVGSPFSGGGLYTLPAQKVREFKLGDTPGVPYRSGVERLIRLIEKRGDWQRLLGSRDAIETAVLATGGHLRDLIRLLQTIAIKTQHLPADDSTQMSAQADLRAQFLPIPDDDAIWLAQIARSHRAELSTLTKVGTLARYFDSHLVLCYRNGDEWFDVHPLVRRLVLDQARAPTNAA